MSVTGYFDTSRSLIYSYLSVLPLLIIYEILLYISQPSSDADIRLTADVWLRAVFSWTGTNTLMITAFLIIVAGTIVFVKERDRMPEFRIHYFLVMVLESLVWAFCLGIFVSAMIGQVFVMAASGQGEITMLQWVALALGAGVYEELVFRVILIAALLFVFRQIFTREWIPTVLAVLFGAAIFSGIHYIGEFGDAFTWPSFMFRMVFGLALTALLIYRGFGIAAWTHSLYDIIVITTWL